MAGLGPAGDQEKKEIRVIDRVVGGSRYLALLAVIGSFLASAIVQFYGLIRVVTNAYDAYIGRD